VKIGSARRVAAAGIAVTGLGAGAAAYLLVGDLPGMLYAAGIALAALVGAVAIVASGRPRVLEEAAPASSRPSRRRRKSHVIAELELDLASTAAELEEHRQALANLAAQLTRESEAAQGNAERLEQRIRELTAERAGLQQLLAEEREVFEETLTELGGGLGRHGVELERLERELEALIAR
jgi:predicted RNase H-like nuclease (RuvC/YqgF family)